MSRDAGYFQCLSVNHQEYLEPMARIQVIGLSGTEENKCGQDSWYEI